MTTEQNLKEGFKEFLDGAIDEENKSRFKLAVTAYFKAITQICDLIILRKDIPLKAIQRDLDYWKMNLLQFILLSTVFSKHIRIHILFH